MSFCFSKLVGTLLVLTAASVSSVTYAQATRTWVSGVGDDANPCSRTAPCKTFAGAISKTAEGGIINAIDPGGYGSVTIVKSITIDGGESMSSILAPGTHGITINAPGALVILRNLHLSGNNTSNGVNYVAANLVVVDNLQIDGFANAIAMGAGANNGRLDIRGTHITGSQTGINISGRGADVSVANSVIRGTGTGITGASGHINVRGSDIVLNSYGINSSGVRISSFGDNRLFGNGVDGAFRGQVRPD